MSWSAFDEGNSLGKTGSEDGKIRRDEEHDLGARITLEQNCTNAPWSITCGIYGWMFHTRYFSTEEQGNSEYDLMKLELTDVLAIVSLDDQQSPDRSSAVSFAIEKFVERFE